MNKYFLFLGIFFLLLLNSCATYEPQYADNVSKPDDYDNSALSRKQIKTSFYLIGDAGGDRDGGSTYGLDAFKKVIDTSNTHGDYAIFLGDNIYEAGLPEEDNPERAEAERRLNSQLTSIENFKGKSIFIPGNHDWYADGVEGVKRQEKYIEKALGDKDAFQPENGCPIRMISVNDDIELMLLDTQWYLEDWDKHPTINDKCNIRTREQFFLEIEGEFKKNNEKTIIVAMHHPMFTNGSHGGKFSFDKHLYPTQNRNLPLPGLASLAVQLRSQGGVTVQDRSNNQYNALMKRLATLAQETDKVVFASGHEHSLQYIENKGIKQIISGSGAKKSGASLGNDGLFAYGGQGFAILDVYEDASSAIRFYAANKGEPILLFTKELFSTPEEVSTANLPTSFTETIKATIYNENVTDKSDSYKSFWGDHYREVYGTPIEVSIATLDTLKGGFTIDRKGGGHQTRSLRLKDKDGRNFSLRAVHKSAVQFLQSVAFKNDYIQDEFKDTFTEDAILDFYTAGHPYASLAIPTLADAVGVYHTNPQLLYVPKHKALGKYNETYGDELYFIEERPDDGFLDVASFGNPDSIDSSDDLYNNLRADEKYSVDEPAFIRARIFDMLLGDWDRHSDQWRWARFDNNGKKVYRPIPRDRDQVFSKFDGTFLGILKALIPPARQFQNYDGDLKNIKWINEAGIKMDRALIMNSGKDVWKKEATFIKENLSDEVIDLAFTKLPKEVQHIAVDEIKRKLKERRDKIVGITDAYARYLNDLVIITGTDKDDHFEITRKDEETLVEVSRIKNGKIMPPFITRKVRSIETKDVWIYGLDDDDTFHVSGNGKSPIRLKLIGGQENDVYNIEDGRKVKVYEYKTKETTVTSKGGARFVYSNMYSLNTYDPLKKKNFINSVIPIVGFNPDDGLLIGITDIITTTGFNNDPFTTKHIFNVGYYGATEGINLNYDGVFVNTFGQWNLNVGGHFTNGSFADNFFGLGNETVNNDDDLGLDYNRVRNGNIEAYAGVEKDNTFGSTLSFTAKFERVEIEDTEGRFITEDFIPTTNDFFDGQSFLGLEGAYNYESSDNAANPTRGMEFRAIFGAKTNLNDGDRAYAYLHPKLGFYNALTNNRKLVLKTLVQAQINFGDDFEFYQAARVGGGTGLRGYRFNRFTGESAFAGSADLRYSFKRFRTAVLPVQFGIFGGGDLGRVWLDGENSDKWYNDYGGGFWINMVETISGQLGAFTGEDGTRINFKFGVRL